MKAIVITENNMGAGHFGNNEVIARPPGAQIVGDIFTQNGYDVQNIDFFGSWDHDKLLDLLCDWVNDEEVIVSFSISLSFYDSGKYQTFGMRMKERNPKAKCIIGGVRYADSLKTEKSILYKDSWLDAIFLGRSMRNFDTWLKGNVESLPTRMQGSTLVIGTDKELEKYYEDMLTTFRTDGWKTLTEDLHTNAEGINSVEATKDEKDLYKVQGELSIIRMLTNFEQFIEQGYEASNLTSN